ncbi:MAG: peptidoglycan D,D-transpeptidase FtsI family protein [Armatimonadota bacterium]
MNNAWETGRDIRRAAMIPAIGFGLLCLVLGYWQVVKAPDLRASEHNTRARERVKNTRPGEVRDIDGETLLGVTGEVGEWKRTYPAGEFVCHITGYNNNSGVQKGLRDALLGIGAYESPWSDFIEGPLEGNDVTLTVNLEAQELATRLLRGNRGAVVALDARTGAILTMVSAPAYDPAKVLDSEWDYQMFQEDPDRPEINRAVQGLYPPGSVMKILTAAAVLDLGRVRRDTEFECDGEYTLDGATITCPRSHGTVTLDQALQVSCNTTFAKLGDYLTDDEFVDYVEQLHLPERARVPIPSSAGSIPDFTGETPDVLLAESLIGQGKTLVTPLAIARLTLALANEGVVIEPYLTETVTGPSGKVLRRARPREEGRAVSAEAAAAVAGMMVNVVEEGTGEVAAIRGFEVAGKTGSAQNPHGRAHSWFTAFAPADSPRVVVTVVVENAGAGSEAAGPIVREVMTHLLGR